MPPDQQIRTQLEIFQLSPFNWPLTQLMFHQQVDRLLRQNQNHKNHCQHQIHPSVSISGTSMVSLSEGFGSFLRFFEHFSCIRFTLSTSLAFILYENDNEHLYYFNSVFTYNSFKTYKSNNIHCNL